MDITIPPHNLKRLTASITCLGKIGKDLYLSFDPLDGLTLSSLNEAKSAYGKFHFEPRYFERCSAPTVGSGGIGGSSKGLGNHDDDDDSDEEFYDTRYVCRVPVRSVHSILRPRKGVCSLRIRSEGMDDNGNYFGLNKKKRQKKRSHHRGHRSREGDGDDEDGEDEGDGRRRRRDRGSFSARERRSRKRRKEGISNKRNNDEDEGSDDNADDPTNSISQNTDKMMLSFEFFIERPAPQNANTGNRNAPLSNGGVFRVLHKVGVTDANGITLSASVTQSRTRSEIVTPPKLWLRLLDPLRRTAEVALTIDDELKVVTATSFHPGEIQQLNNENAVLQAAAARNAALKTETSTGVEEFTEYDFRNNRGKRRRRRRGVDGNDSEESENGRIDEEDEYDFEKESERPPLDVNQKVILVFSIKEAKAMLQFSAHTNSIDDDGVVVSFHWGGKPIVIETDGDFFSAELVLATLHHGMIASNITVGGGGLGGGERRASPVEERN